MPKRLFPHHIYLVHHLPTNSYGSVYTMGERGLACFSRASTAQQFAQRMETQRNLIVEMTMADACEVAALVQLPLLVLADAPDEPLIHRLPCRKSHS